MWPHFVCDAIRQRRTRKLLASSPLKSWLAQPLVKGSQTLSQAKFLALDLETTGLDCRRDHILSIGAVDLDPDAIALAGRYYQLVHTPQNFADDSIIIHGITHNIARQGKRLKDVLPWLIDLLVGKVLIAHHAAIEVQFIQQACLKCYGIKPIIATVDTMLLAKQKLDRGQQAYRDNDLRLHALRRRFHLPVYKAHNALVDALSAAELFVALVAHSNQAQNLTLSDVGVQLTI